MIDWRTAHLPLAAGMQQKADPRALEAPALAVCKNAEFDELGGIQKRKPFSQIAGVAPGDIRRMAIYDGELVCFTKDEIYQYSAANGSWNKASDYVATRVWEREVNVRTTDQIDHECAVLDGVAVYAWAEGADVHYVALDATTHVVLAGPATLSAHEQPRLVAMANRILMFVLDTSGTTLYGKGILPSNVGSSTQGEGLTGAFTSVGAVTTQQYDVRRNPTTDTATLAYHYVSGYRVRTATGGTTGALSMSSALSKARAADVVAVASMADGTTVVARLIASTNDCYADLLDNSLDDDVVSVDMSAGIISSTAQLTCCWRSKAESTGAYVCRVFWSTSEPVDLGWSVETNTIDTTGSAGTVSSDVIWEAGIASHAFDYDGDVYVWLSFGKENGTSGLTKKLVGFQAALFNGAHLMREDFVLCGKAASGRAEAMAANLTAGWLPTVQNIDGARFSVGLSYRRRLELGDDESDGYAERSPLVVEFEIDSDSARRAVQFGSTLYISNGQLTQFDGNAAVEVGFLHSPFYIFGNGTGTGSLEAGDYVWTASYAWTNAKGERERSGRAVFALDTMGASTSEIITISVLALTGKRSDLWTRRTDCSIEVWRTKKNPPDGASFYLCSGLDPLTRTGNNAYVLNDAADANWLIPSTSVPPAPRIGFEDGYADSTLETQEPYPIEEVEAACPPGASIVAQGSDRLFIAGIPGEPYTVRYSKYRSEGEVAHFADILRVRVPPDSGVITALAFLNETFVAFCERGIYMLPGDGYDNTGDGQNYGPARLLSVDVGAQTAEGVAVTPDGIIFRSTKGWYLLTRGWAVEYIGSTVSDFDSDTLVAAHVLDSKHQVRIVSEERILVLNTITKQWSEWDQVGCVGSVIWKGQHVIATSNDEILVQRSDFDQDVDYSLDVETAWIKLNGLQGYMKCRRVMPLGEYRSSHRLQVRVARNMQETDDGPVWMDNKKWTPSPTTVGGPEQVSHRLSNQRCHAIKVRLTDRHTLIDEPAQGEALKLTGLSIEYGVMSGLQRLPAAQKQ